MRLKIFYFAIFSTILAISEVHASSGDCSYETNQYTGYGCTLDFHDAEDTSNFTYIGGDHDEGKTDDNVLGVWVYTEMYNPNVAPFLCNKFNNLERLFFRRVSMEELPENSFSSCKNLNSLNLQTYSYSSSYITELPQNLLAGNPKLSNFEASLKALRSIPENFFAKNSELRRVSIKDSNLRTLPANIFKPLVNLNELILSKNDIQTINPAWFESLENLLALYLNDNSISEIPKNAFKPLKNLVEIWISFNSLTVIHSDSFDLHPKLESVNLMNNYIYAIDEKFIDNIGAKNFQFFSNSCANNQFYDENGEKGALKDGLKRCFENYQTRADADGN